MVMKIDKTVYTTDDGKVLAFKGNSGKWYYYIGTAGVTLNGQPMDEIPAIALRLSKFNLELAEELSK